MQEEINSVEKLTENLKEYANTRYEIVTLHAAQKAANIGSQSVALILIAIFGSMFLLFINIAAAFYISDLMSNSFAGFFIVSGFYLCLTVILLLCRKKAIVLPLRNLIIKQILSND
jgi:hypothetical protein